MPKKKHEQFENILKQNEIGSQSSDLLKNKANFYNKFGIKQLMSYLLIKLYYLSRINYYNLDNIE